jgi:hypothetical protein
MAWLLRVRRHLSAHARNNVTGRFGTRPAALAMTNPGSTDPDTRSRQTASTMVHSDHLEEANDT